MTDTPRFKLELGSRYDAEICDEPAKVGYNVVNGVPMAAYLPKSNKRPDVGTKLTLGNDKFEILEVKQSETNLRMVVLVLKEVADGNA